MTRPAQAKKILSPLGQAQLTFDIRAGDIQALSFRSAAYRQGRRDYYTAPRYLPQANQER